MWKKTTYWISTGLLSAFMFFSVGMYTFNYEFISSAYILYGFPLWVIPFNATAKFLGAIALLWGKEPLKQWAYAGFLYIFLMAFIAHLLAADGQWQGTIVALLLWTVSFAFSKSR